MLDLQVSGMSCEGCAETVRRAVALADADARVEVRLDTGRVHVETSAPADSVRQAIEMKGYFVERVTA